MSISIGDRMKVFKEGNRLPIKIWCGEVESNAMTQATTKGLTSDVV